MNIPKGFKLAPVDIDALAQFIRKVDGDNRMGAGTLAEHIAEWLDLDAQPIYDEAKERQLFEAFASTNYVVPPGVGHLFVRAEVGEGYRLSNINHAWHGWLSCAQSRARAGEDE